MMTHEDEPPPRRHQDNKGEQMFWYWLPVAGAAISLIFIALHRWLGP
jgi:hypothetical protein